MKKSLIFILGIIFIVLIGCKVDNNSKVASNSTKDNGINTTAKQSNSANSSSNSAETTAQATGGKTVATTNGTAKTTVKPTTEATAKSAAAITSSNRMALYFDLLDFMRTKSLGGSHVTASSERKRVTTLVTSYWSYLDSSTKSAINQMAKLGQTVKSDYDKRSTSEKNKLKADWEKTVLSPLWLYAPLNSPKTYTDGSTVSFNYPSEFTGGQASDSGIDYLFLGKNGSAASWTQVLESSTSPTGALFVKEPITSAVASYTPLELARYYIAFNITPISPDMKEINKIETTLGACVVLKGHFDGQSEIKFMWILIIPNRSRGEYALCRMGGPVSLADTLVPEYYNILNTLNWSTKPVGGSSGSSSGEASSAFDTAWSRVSTAVVADIWAPSGN